MGPSLLHFTKMFSLDFVFISRDFHVEKKKTRQDLQKLRRDCHPTKRDRLNEMMNSKTVAQKRIG